MKSIYLTLITISLTGCFSSIMDDEYTLVDPKIKPHYDKFMEEATLRGIKFNTTNVKINFGPTGGVAGTTFHKNSRIVIDSTSVNWRLNPESLIFHELGHLLLVREHEDKWLKGIDNKNYSGSIMNEFGSNYSEDKREYYVNELFDPSTPKPDWSR